MDFNFNLYEYFHFVVPHAGTWIEIMIHPQYADRFMSFPTRERGLKFETSMFSFEPFIVVPHAGTWIEMRRKWRKHRRTRVVPHAGTWIEIQYHKMSSNIDIVVPHAGTWIEIVKHK